jgi:hypothetical protein
MSDLLNVHGKQTVANLQMSVSAKNANTTVDLVGDETPNAVRLSMDFTSPDDLDGHTTRRQNGYHHTSIFGQIVTARGEEIEDELPDNQDSRERRRQIGETIIKR